MRIIEDCGEYNCVTDHAFHIDEPGGLLTLVKGRKNAYLSASNYRGTISVGNGRTLRLLAEAILREAAPAPKKAKVKR